MSDALPDGVSRDAALMQLERNVAERLNELGVTYPAIFDINGNIVRFFERSYILLVRDYPDEKIEVILLNVGGRELSSLCQTYD